MTKNTSMNDQIRAAAGRRLGPPDAATDAPAEDVKPGPLPGGSFRQVPLGMTFADELREQLLDGKYGRRGHGD